jgi:hypothetical protein
MEKKYKMQLIHYYIKIIIYLNINSVLIIDYKKNLYFIYIFK